MSFFRPEIIISSNEFTDRLINTSPYFSFLYLLEDMEKVKLLFLSALVELGIYSSIVLSDFLVLEFEPIVPLLDIELFGADSSCSLNFLFFSFNLIL